MDETIRPNKLALALVAGGLWFTDTFYFKTGFLLGAGGTVVILWYYGFTYVQMTKEYLIISSPLLFKLKLRWSEISGANFKQYSFRYRGLPIETQALFLVPNKQGEAVMHKQYSFAYKLLPSLPVSFGVPPLIGVSADTVMKKINARIDP